MSDAVQEIPTLFDWAGGHEPMERMLNAFYDRVEADELISPMFPGGVGADHRRAVTAWWCEVFGGPPAYSQGHGGYENMLAHHLNLGITPEQRLRFVTLISLAADDAGLPADPEFRSALLAYAEWGTRLAFETRSPARRRSLVHRSRAGGGRSPALPPLIDPGRAPRTPRSGTARRWCRASRRRPSLRRPPSPAARRASRRRA